MRTNETTARGEHVCDSTGFAEIAPRDLERSLVARFADRAAAHRDCLAVRDPELSLTYGELDRWANAIAASILDLGAGGSPVVILLPQGARNVVAVLGALKAGSPYVSLDTADPRSSALAGRVGATVAVGADRDALPLPTIVVDEPAQADEPHVAGGHDDIAYVFFTSGSTGDPKGVFDTHRNVLHNVLRYTNTLRIAPGDRCSLIQSPSFSGTASTVFSALLNGASLHAFPLDRHGIAALGRWLLDERVTIYHSVPAIFRSLVQVEPGPYDDVRVVRLEGDRASWHDVELQRRSFPASRLVNGLGLTETGLVRQFFVGPDAEPEPGALPVGYPVPDVEVVVIGEDGTKALPGAIGEIAVQCDHLARGYWDDVELSASRFPELGGRRTYLTGDLGRLRQDGCLEYLGRRDGQLKVLGNRVEPAEVEAELLRLPGVRDAAVTTRPGRRGEGQLVAYIVCEPTSAARPETIRDTLSRRLPAFMVPAVVVFVDALPVAASGKVDRAALPEVRAAEGPPPATPLEQRIARIWEDVLERRRVGRDDDFFALGGDSLAAAEIVARLQAETGVALPISALAGAPAVRELAAALQRSESRAASSLVELRPEGELAPLVVLHGNLGHALHYADLVRALDPSRPVWALEHREPIASSIDEMSAAHMATLLARLRDGGPVHLAGFCYGAVVAHELARRLTDEGRRVGLLALLGITPLEFPTLVSPDARRAWGHRYAAPPFTAKVRDHVDRARTLPLGERPAYIGRRVANLVGGTARRLAGRLDEDRKTAFAFERALSRHHPSRFPGHALVVLHTDDTLVYATRAELEWSPLAEEVEVIMLPGAHHAMLERPGVHELAALLRGRLGTIEGSTA